MVSELRMAVSDFTPTLANVKPAAEPVAGPGTGPAHMDGIAIGIH